MDSEWLRKNNGFINLKVKGYAKQTLFKKAKIENFKLEMTLF